MTAPVRTDETTGLRVFNTRAAKATERIAGKGYSPIDDEALKTLPEPPPGAAFNAEGGFAPLDDFLWSAAAEEQLDERLGKLLGDG